MLKFEKFLKENDSKRQRAVLKAQTERKSREQKEQELAQLQQVLRDYQARNEQFKQRLGTFVKELGRHAHNYVMVFITPRRNNRKVPVLRGLPLGGGHGPSCRLLGHERAAHQ